MRDQIEIDSVFLSTPDTIRDEICASRDIGPTEADIFAKYTVCTYLYAGMECQGPQSLHDHGIEKERCPTQVKFDPERNNFNFDHRGKHTFQNGYTSLHTEFWMYKEASNRKHDKCYARNVMDGPNAKINQAWLQLLRRVQYVCSPCNPSVSKNAQEKEARKVANLGGSSS